MIPLRPRVTLAVTFIVWLGVSLSGCVPSYLGDIGPRVGAFENEMLQAPRAPITLWSAAPGLGAAARDYLYVAPLDTNISGERQLYLWFGFASSVDRVRRPDAFAGMTELTLALGDGTHGLLLEPVEATSVIRTALPPIRTFRAKVDSALLAALAAPGALLVHTGAGSSTVQEFTLFAGDRTDWADVASENRVQIRASTHHAPLSAPDVR